MKSSGGFSLVELVMVVAIVAMIAAGGYLFVARNSSIEVTNQHSNSATQKTIPTATPMPSPTVVQVDAKTSKYIDYEHHFSVTFPRQETGLPTTCADWQKQANNSTQPMSPMSLGIYEDKIENTLYFSGAVVAEWTDKPIGNGAYENDPNSCRVVDNSLSLIKNGYDTGMNSKRTSGAARVVYGSVTNDDELLAFTRKSVGVQSIYSKVLVQSSPEVYKINYTIGGVIGPGEILSYYCPTYHVAVFSGPYQSPAFNGTNGQTEPLIEFFN